MISAFNFFKAIYCINLPERKDRRESAEAEFKKVGILDRVIFVDGIVHENVHVGFNLAMIECLKLGVKCGGPFLITEDDVRFKQQFYYNHLRAGKVVSFYDNCLETHLYYILQRLSKRNWDLLYLGGTFYGEVYEGKKVSDRLKIAKDILTTHAIAFNTKSAVSILNNFSQIDLADPKHIFDLWLLRNVQPLGRSYIAAPMIAYQKPFYSDLRKEEMDYTKYFEETDKKMLSEAYYALGN